MHSVIKLWKWFWIALIAVISVRLVVVAEMNAVYDLSAYAIPFDKHSLQLNVSFISPNINGTKFDIIVKPHLDDYCNSRTCAEYGILFNSSGVLMPRDPQSIIDHKECSIEPSCNYTIKVDTANSIHSAVLIYQVPDCVGDICSCRHSKTLPNMTLGSDISVNEISVQWNISQHSVLPSDVRLEGVSIRVGVQKNPSLTWGGQYKPIAELLVPISGNYKTLSAAAAAAATAATSAYQYFGSKKIQLPEKEPPGSRFLIRAHIIDSRGCRGIDANYTISVPDGVINDASQTKLNALNINYVIVIVLLIMLVITVLLCTIPRIIKIRRKKNNTILNWRGIYHNVPSSHNGISQIAMQENSLYVDKDILDARQRGEADLMEVAHTSLAIGREIGKGAFGRVFIARADNIRGKQGSEIVAVKQLKKRPTADELEEFLSEIATMKQVGRHPNVVTLLGCCTIKQPLCMIMEHVGCGDLLHYLRQLRAQHEARSTAVSGIVRPGHTDNSNQSSIGHSNSELFGKYLELFHSSSSNATSSDASYHRRQNDHNVANIVRPSLTETMYTMLSTNPDGNSVSMGGNSLNYVLDHRELQSFAIQIARGMSHLEMKNITHRDLAARNILIDETKTLKISDFGLSRSGIYVNTRNKRVPLRWLSLEAVRDSLYSSKSDVWAFGIVLWEIGTLGGFPYPNVSNQELLSYLTSGQRLQRPENCSEHLYGVMQQCWLESPENRPSFAELVAKLEPQHQKIYVDFNELEPDYVFPPTLEMLKNNNTKAEVKY